MSDGPFLRGPFCGCCASCEWSGGNLDGCVEYDAPRYLSVRLSKGTDAFPAEVPLDWGTGTKVAGSAWVYTYILPWLRKHVAGEGPDIVLECNNFPLTGDKHTWKGFVRMAAQVAGTFTGEPSDPANGDDLIFDMLQTNGLGAWGIYVEFDLDFTATTSRIEMYFSTSSSGSGTPFFASTMDRPACEKLLAIPSLQYLSAENEKAPDPDGTYTDTDRHAISKRAGGGSAHIRPCAVMNSLPQGGLWLNGNISALTGDYVPRHKNEWDVTLDWNWCLNGELSIGVDDTATMKNPYGVGSSSISTPYYESDADFEFTRNHREDPETPGEYGCQFDITSTTTYSNKDLRIQGFGAAFRFREPFNASPLPFSGVKPTFFPWADSSFDPQTDSLADGATLDIWAQNDAAEWSVIGTAVFPNLHADADEAVAGPVYGGDPSKCYEYTDAAGFDFTHLETPEGDYYCRSIAGMDAVDADTFDEWAAKMAELMPWGTTFTKVDAATAPLLETITIHDWRSSRTSPAPKIKNGAIGAAFSETLTSITCP